MSAQRKPRGPVRAGALALVLSAAVLAPVAEAQQAPGAGDPLQAVPEAQPDTALPPPILPAPDLPTDEPLVGAPAAPAASVMPGLPTNPNGTIFSFADLAAGLLDSVVYISTAQSVTISRSTPLPDEVPDAPDEELFEDFFEDESSGGEGPSTVQSLGSGFVIDAEGLIVTNNHVIADADEIVANFASGAKLEAEVVGVDEKTDLALLKVEPKAPLQVARFGRSQSLRVGDWVLAIGNPFGFGGSVTAGIVSALDRDINSGPYDHYIQTDASINRGNSGGPLFNVAGEVVGINTAIMSPTGGSIGIGFAVPSEIAVPVIEQLREFGEVRRGWIGVRIQDVTDDGGAADDGPDGALVAGLTPGGPAEKAGILAGDVIVEFGGREIESMRALPGAVADTPPGDEVDAVILRDGERLTLSVEVGLLGEVETAAADAATDGEEAPLALAPDLFGLTLGAITEEARQSFGIGAGVEGVLVTEVAPGSEAEEKSVKPGDVIVQVSQEDVRNADEVMARVKQLKAEGRRTVMFLVSSAEDKLRFVSLRFEDAQ
jgi:serine protease Do